jgi:MFS family permease
VSKETFEMTLVRELPTRTLATAAAAFVLGYPCLVIAANVIQRDHYDAASQAMSNLALGRDGWLMTLAFISLGVGNLLMAPLVRRLAPRAIVGPGLLAASACTTLLSAVFQTDADSAPTTVHGTIHIALGLGSFVLVIAAMTACSVAYFGSSSRRRLGIACTIWAVVELGAVVLTFVLPSSLFGIGQRAILAVAISWLLTTCLVAFRDAPDGSARSLHSAAPSLGSAR